ncbi:hypothetical protein ACWEPC_02850 [Nonomuraea sp. NPDC004297]
MARAFKINDRVARQLARELEKKIQREMKGVSVPVTAERSTAGRNGGLDANTLTGLLGVRLLDWLYDRRHTSVVPVLREFPVAEAGSDAEIESERELQLVDQVDILGDMGLLQVNQMFGGEGAESRMASLTDAGVQDVVHRRQRRQDVQFRTATCRRNLLRWLYEQQYASAAEDFQLARIGLSAWGNVEGDVFTGEEIHKAASYLLAKELIVGQAMAGRALDTARLTDAGVDCVENYEGSVSDYMTNSQAGGVSFVNNFNAAVSHMQLGQAGRDVSQRQTVEGVDTQALIVLARALREAGPLLGMTEAPTAEIVRVADQLELVAQEEDPNPERLRGILSWGRDVLANASGSALGAVLLSVISSVAGG